MTVTRLLLVSIAHSETPRNSDLDRVRSEIVRLKNRLQAVQSQAQSAERDLEVADVEVGIRTRELDLAIDMQAQIEAQQHDLEAQVGAIEPRIAHQKTFLAKRLVALYRLRGVSCIRLLLFLPPPRHPLQAMSTPSFLLSRDAPSPPRPPAPRRRPHPPIARLGGS